MTAAPLPDPSALSPDMAVRLAAVVASVLAAPVPAQALYDVVVELDTEQNPALSAALYEAVCYRIGDCGYWLHSRMVQVYRLLGPAREDAAFYHAATVARLQPDWSGSDYAFRFMFLYLVRRGREREALDLFRHQMRYLPEHPAAAPDELAPILRRLEPQVAPGPRLHRPEALRLHPVVAAEARPPWTCPVFGGDLPYALKPLTQGVVRPEIVVAEFADAEVLMVRETLVVVDRFGDVHEQFSIGDYPALLHANFLRQEAAGQSVPLHAAEDAVVIADIYGLANICHALFDQITRLALYRRAGVATGQALVIGAEARIAAQREILRRAGVTAHLGTTQMQRVRARRLWVSSNCRDLRHAAHFGAAWAVSFAQATLGGQGTKGWRRLYLSRADAGMRRVANEDAVMALLEPHGFECIVPGGMPYEAQLAAFRQASHVIAPHGAGLAHLILCPQGAHVLEIFHPLYGSAAYAQQVAACGLHYAAMLARDWEFDTPEWNDPNVSDVHQNRYQARHMRVDLPTLSRYLATLD